FFKFDSNPKFDELYYYLKKEILQKIINFMKQENKALKITEISVGLKKNHNTIKKYLYILKDLNLVKVEKDNKRKLFIFDTKKYTKVRKLIQGV
ncbi:MAG: hypothetical protein HWN81_18270, partial [Candidatus Lokiarchaeota archaeon]|nr:hypothetical protein [Candidatus Lokiarchaeota archaeon]